MDRWAELFMLAARQHGVMSVADARRCGIPESTLRHRAAKEGWERQYRGVWALPGPVSPMRDSAAALLAAGSGAALARRSAAWLWELRPGPPARPEVIVAHEAGRARHPGLMVLRSTKLRPGEVVARQGLAITAPARTLADLARVTSQERLLAMVVQARQRGIVGVPELVSQVAGMRGVPGIQRLRTAVELLDGHGVDSMLELEIRGGLRAAALPPPADEPVWLGSGPGKVQIDIAWPDVRVGVEVDSFAYHHTAEDLARDHRKANVAAAAGWVLLRVGYLRWLRDRAAFVAEVREVLRQRGALAAGSLAADIGRK